MTLTVHNAEIRTATVEIKWLTISGKQVTQAVFKQLVAEPLIDKEGSFRGLPWGVVNYHPSRDCDHTDRTYGQWDGHHLHVVWQKGSDLRRASVLEPRQSLEAADYDCQAAETWIAAAVLEGWRPRSWTPRSVPGTEYLTITDDRDGWAGRLLVPDDVHRFFNMPTTEPYQDSSSSWAAEGREQWAADRRQALDALREIAAGRSRLDAWEGWRDVARARDARLAHIQDRWQELTDLPQLFIAV